MARAAQGPAPAARAPSARYAPDVLRLRLVCLPVVLGAAIAGGACTRTVNVRVEGAHTKASVAGTDLGEVPPAGEPVVIPVGMEPVPFEVDNRGTRTVGSLARTEPVWWLIAAGVLGAACCAPSLATAGFCLANPAIIGAPLAFAVAGDVGALTAPCVAPSWLTLPVVTGCTAVGMTPLGFALTAETLPDEIVLLAPAAEEPPPPREPRPPPARPRDGTGGRPGKLRPLPFGPISGDMGY